jgi:predicted DNA-binding transcriptional regulator YafY
MRAARVLDMLLVLQRRGRLTARELGATLEVSERTVLRDVEALSEAGVPIYATRGSGGGIELMDGFETRLTGLTSDEAHALFLAGQLPVARLLGLGAPARSARQKLSSALPQHLAQQADGLAAWFLHDPEPAGGPRPPPGELRRVAAATRRRRRVELHRTGRPPCVVAPLGLVLKAASWHLVVGRGEVVDVICLDDLVATRLTAQRFDVPAGFSLPGFWAAHRAAARQRGRPARRS